jgi:hypothetical protein
MLKMGLPVGGGTDGTRVASYHPWTCLWWLVTGKTVGGTVITDKSHRLERQTALDVWTRGSAWFSGEEEKKGELAPGKYADLAVLSDDYFTVEEDKIRGIESVLTIVGGRIVHADQEFTHHRPGLPPVSPDWSPVGTYGGYYNQDLHPGMPIEDEHPDHLHGDDHWIMGADGRIWQSGCGCSV